MSQKNTIEGIAIIGMAGRFPGAGDIRAFWDNIVSGVESVSQFTAEELECPLASETSLRTDPNYIKSRPILDDVDLFAATFFGVNPKEAALMDPQHRIFLECAWSALEDAGYDRERYSGLIGVYGGQSMNTYLLANVCTGRDFAIDLTGHYQVGGYNVVLGNDKDYLATRVSYKLDLSGPSMTVQTACSTSLVAVVQACQSLLTYQCDMALAGGVSITFPQKRGYLYQEGGMVSGDGHCRAFDAKADGTIFGSGAGVLLLKRAEDAVADGDHIYAVIKGSAVNNDGSLKVGYTAPSVDRQAEVIAAAQAIADVDPGSISYIETHGTGTPLGDPIEVAALKKAFGSAVVENSCGIGSVKTNIGHLEVASGVTGLIKTAMCLEKEMIPATIHFERPNPELGLEGSPFYVVDKLKDWKKGPAPRRAGVSSFGVGGTNAHVILEEAPGSVSSPSRPIQLLVLSAKTPSALEAATTNLAAFLRTDPGADIADVAYTLQIGRRQFQHRRVIPCSTLPEAVELLESRDPKVMNTDEARPQPPNPIFVFPGQGTQAINMGRGLYDSEPEFRSHVDTCAEILKQHIDADIRDALYPDELNTEKGRAMIQLPSITQPAIFVIEYALARMWQDWGVKPTAMVGHSVGEYAAACIAGVISLEDALAVLAARGRLTEELPSGSMLAIRLAPEDIAKYVENGLSLASVNAPNLSVLSGAKDHIADLQARLDAHGVASKLLKTSHAFHSAMVEPILPKFVDLISKVRFNSPAIPYVSSLTGNWITEEEVRDPQYWARHFREPVLFAAAVDQLAKDPNAIFVEVGPGQTLSRLIRQSVKRSGQEAIATLGDECSTITDQLSVMKALGHLWTQGVEIDWSRFYARETRLRVSLPTYPFERQRYWVEPAAGIGPALVKDPALFYTQTPDDDGASNNEMTSIAPAGEKVERRQGLADEVARLFQELSGLDAAELEPSATFLDLGFDSLFLTQASQSIQTKFGVKVAFRQMLDDLSTLETLTEYIDDNLPADSSFLSVPAAPAEAMPAATQARPKAPVLSSEASGNGVRPAADTSIERIIQQQLDAMSQLAVQQLAVLGREAVPQHVAEPEPASASLAVARNDRPVVKLPERTAAVDEKKARPYSPFRAVEKGRGGAFTPRQQAGLDDLIARFTAKTSRSKAMAQKYRAVFADPRAAAGFRSQWKELIYPVVVDRSAGSRIWDVDGNEYVDIVNGFGVTLFGHTPDFVAKAVEEQLKLGFEIGPMGHRAGEVAALICELTGNDRVTFCNTGSEAVQGALRLARTVTGRKLVATFAGDYHGGFDEVLVRPNISDGYLTPAPVAPGIPQESVDNMLVLDYGSPESLQVIREHAHELAAVLLEPVQSRHPALRPIEYLKELRDITERTWTPLLRKM